jgi:hypothetical protein
VVDDFGIKYSKLEDHQDLIQALKELYTITIDWTGHLFCGISIAWNYKQCTVDLSMSVYIEVALKKFQHIPDKTEHSPYEVAKPMYHQGPQMSPELALSPTLSGKQENRIQPILGTLSYYAWAVDPTMLAAINSITIQLASPTEKLPKPS